MVSIQEGDKGNMDQFFSDGVTEEKNQNNKGYQLTQEQIKVSGEVDFM
jgi:hypothetical protein